MCVCACVCAGMHVHMQKERGNLIYIYIYIYIYISPSSPRHTASTDFHLSPQPSVSSTVSCRSSRLHSLSVQSCYI